jgi:hypothetical protein
MTDPITEAVVTAAQNVPGDLLLLGAAAVESRRHSLPAPKRRSSELALHPPTDSTRS